MAILTFVEYKKCVSNKMASVDINKFKPPGGFKCPSPEELILLSDGSQKRAGDLVVGDTVKTRHEKTNEINNFAVSYVEIIPNTKRCKLNFELNSLVCSYSHKLLVGTEWKTAEDLIFGDVVSGQAFLGTEPVEDGDVVLITVEDAHTYIVNGLLSHNKSLPMNPEVQPGKIRERPTVDPRFLATSCPSPDELILLSNGLQKRAGEIIVGDSVKTRHELTDKVSNFPVSYVEIIPNSKRCKLTFEFNSLVCSYSHKLLVGTEWKTAEDLIFGDVVSGQAFLGTEPVEDGDVVLITVEDAHTYIVNGLQSHNKRPGPSKGGYGGPKGNPPVAPTISGSSSGSGQGTPVNPNNIQVNVNPNEAQIGSGYSVPTGAIASAPPNAGTQTGSFDFKKIMDSFYNYKPKEDGDATDMQKQAYQGNMVQSILDSQLAQQLGQYNAGLAQDNMTHQADLEQRNQSGLMADEFAYGMAGMDAQFKYGEQGQQNQHERDIGMLSATGEEQRLNLAAQGDQDRLGQIVTGEQNRLTNDLNNQSSEAIASGRYSADTTIASTQADASKYGSKEAADASKYGSQASKDASIYGSDRSKEASVRSSEASEFGAEKSKEASVRSSEASEYGSRRSAEASEFGAEKSKEASVRSSEASEYGSRRSAEASEYGSDKALEGSKYSTDGTIRNTRATGDETRKTMGTEQQLKAKERASMHKYARGTARAM